MFDNSFVPWSWPKFLDSGEKLSKFSNIQKAKFMQKSKDNSYLDKLFTMSPEEILRKECHEAHEKTVKHFAEKFEVKYRKRRYEE